MIAPGELVLVLVHLFLQVPHSFSLGVEEEVVHLEDLEELDLLLECPLLLLLSSSHGFLAALYIDGIAAPTTATAPPKVTAAFILS